jgi:hypothetical protein
MPIKRLIPKPPRQRLKHAITSAQRAAAIDPALSIRELVRRTENADSSADKAQVGSFDDIEVLLEQFRDAPVYELGKPEPEERYLPKARAGKCPVAHIVRLDCDDLV